MSLVVQVCIPHTNRDCFDYYALDEGSCIGARVWVPFRNKTRLGIIVGTTHTQREGLVLKSIISVIDDKALFSTDMLNLCRWMSHYYQSPLSEVIPLALPKKYRQGEACQLPMSVHYDLAVSVEEAHLQLGVRAIKQHALIDLIANSTITDKKALAHAGYTAQLHALVASGILIAHERVDRPLTAFIGELSEPLPLNDEQASAVVAIAEHLMSYRCFLLHGVTGSGKTEVYLQVIARVLAQGRQVLVLVPEIGLTPQLLTRFSARFRQPMVVIHSHLNDSERKNAWQLAADNEVQLVIGTRSAMFTPMPTLGLIVIDEEHDSSLKQMEGVRYHARDAALMRAFAANIPIVLGSATPSLESLHNCVLKKYTLLRLQQKALASPPLHFQILDIRNQALQDGIASPTLNAIQAHLTLGNQVLVFINRRGFAPVLLCHQCGWMADCHACDSHLTVHRGIHRVVCHHCGVMQGVPKSCPVCKSRELVPVGIGTQRVCDYLASVCPDVALLRVDRDEVAQKHALEARLAQINDGHAQLIVGTQMLAKGHHFPRLTLVVVLDADNGFYNQDFRALESLGQLLIQVAGRAGRAEFPGQVIIQTHLPQHPQLNTLIQDGYEAFAQALLLTRREASLPPYYFLAVIRAQGSQQANVRCFLQAVKEHLQTLGVVALGPAPAPLARKANQHRMQLLVKSATRKALNSALTLMRDKVMLNKTNTGVRWNIDVDPMDLS